MKKSPIFLILFLLSLFLSSCKYDFILPEVVPPIDNGGEPISFSAQVAPIFSNAEKCTSCHKAGGTAPNLVAANAYSQIMTKYVNTTNPEQSLIYSYPAPATGTHTWKKYTALEAATILAWIKEGAENN
jgi:hypothetical protein